jgi:methionyl aminopeptidase
MNWIELSRQRDSTGKRVPIYKPEHFASMRKACQLAAQTLDYITPFVQPGISTAKIDQLCESFMRDHRAIPATIGYRGYQHASCTSINEVVTHGIPSDSRILQPGDIINIDVTPILDKWFGDSSRMYLVGDVSPDAKRLVDTTYEALMAAITEVKPGATLGNVGHAIESIARREHFSVVRDYCGHGIGIEFHAAPQVLHYGRRGMGVKLEPGMIFTIEPMLNAGSHEVIILRDGWTVITRDGKLSAQFEHTIGVTESGVEIFTTSPKGFHRPPYNL